MLDIRQQKNTIYQLLQSAKKGYFKIDRGVTLPNDKYSWTNEHKSLLIESLLLNIPLAHIFVKSHRDGSTQIVDGYKRMKTIFDFMDDKFVLTGVDAEYVGKFYSELPNNLQARMEDTYILVEEFYSTQVTDEFFIKFYNSLH